MEPDDECTYKYYLVKYPVQSTIACPRCCHVHVHPHAHASTLSDFDYFTVKLWHCEHDDGDGDA